MVKSFLSVANATGALLFLVGCVFFSVSATAVGTHYDDSRGGTNVTFSGKTFFPPLPGAAVELRVGGITSGQATADAQGGYSVDLPGSVPAEDLISVKACGQGTQSHICYLRLVDTLENLQASAADPEDLAPGPLSAASTAAYAVLSGVIGEEPTTYSHIEQYRLNFETLHISSVTEVLIGVIRDVVDLPGSSSDTAELALDLEALKALYQYIADSENEAVRQAIEPFMEGLSAHTLLYSRPGIDFQADVAKLARPASLVWAQTGPSILFESGGTGEYQSVDQSAAAIWDNLFEGDLIFKDQMKLVGQNNRYLDIVGVNGEPLHVSIRYPWIDGSSVLEETRLMRSRLRMLDLSETLPLAFEKRFTETVYPENPELGHLESQSQDTVFSVNSVVHDAVDTPDWAPPAAGDSWLIPCFAVCEHDLYPPYRLRDKVTFNGDGTADFERLGLSSSWTASPDGISFSNPKLSDISGLHLGTANDLSLLHYEYDNDEGEPLVVAAYAIQFQSNSGWEPSEVPGRYVSRLNARSFPLIEPSNYFAFEFEADGTGWYGSIDAIDAEPGNPTMISWEITANDRLRISFTGGGGVLVSVREWERIRTVDEKQYVLENYAVNSDFSSDWDPEPELSGPARLNMQERVEP